MEALDVLLALQLAASGVMLGVIWVVQLLVYPTFCTVSAEAWRTHHDSHSARITPIVLPAMAIELLAATLLAISRPAALPTSLVAANLVLAVATWVMTAYVAWRFHGPLGRAHDATTCARLVRANWGRTIVWSARVPVCVLLVLAAA